MSIVSSHAENGTTHFLNVEKSMIVNTSTIIILFFVRFLSDLLLILKLLSKSPACSEMLQ